LLLVKLSAMFFATARAGHTAVIVRVRELVDDD
jgi:hypothetical protein